MYPGLEGTKRGPGVSTVRGAGTMARTNETEDAMYIGGGLLTLIVIILLLIWLL